MPKGETETKSCSFFNIQSKLLDSCDAWELHRITVTVNEETIPKLTNPSVSLLLSFCLIFLTIYSGRFILTRYQFQIQAYFMNLFKNTWCPVTSYLLATSWVLRSDRGENVKTLFASCARLNPSADGTRKEQSE